HLVPKKEEKCHKGNKKLFKARLLLPKKACWFKGKANRIEGCGHPIQTLHSSNKQVPLSVSNSRQWRLGSIIPHSPFPKTSLFNFPITFKYS
ncbi:hypothetical protein ACTFIR_003966, partial [Dictyostelium discoideum]